MHAVETIQITWQYLSKIGWANHLPLNSIVLNFLAFGAVQMFFMILGYL